MGYCVDIEFGKFKDENGKPIFSMGDLDNLAVAIDRYSQKLQGSPEMIKQKVQEFAESIVTKKVLQAQESRHNKGVAAALETRFLDVKSRNLDPIIAAESIFETANHPSIGARYSISGLTNSRHVKLKEILAIGIEENKLKEFTTGNYDVAIKQAMRDLATTGKINLKGVDKYTARGIEAMVKTYRIYNRASIDMLRGSGRYVGEISDYTGKQSWDTIKARAWGGGDFETAFSTWMDDFYPALDRERMFGEHFGDLKTEQSILKTIFTHIYEGEGTHGLGRFTKGRQIHIKTAEDEVRLMQKWATYPTIYENYLHASKGIARHSAITELLGTNPQTSIDYIRKQIDPKDMAKFENMVLMSRGIDEIPGTSLKAKIGGWARTVENSAQLMNNIYAAMHDHVSAAAALQHVSGEWYPKAWFRNLISFVESSIDSPIERRKFFRDYGIMTEAADSLYASRILGDESNYGTGLMSKANQLIYRLNLTKYWTDIAKHAVGNNLVNALTRIAKKGKFSKEDINTFRYYGINKGDLEFMHAKLKDGTVKDLTIDSLIKADNAVFETKLMNTGPNTKRAYKIANMLNQVVDMGIVTGGKKEGRQLVRYLSPDSWSGVITRALSHFKLTPLKQANTAAFLMRTQKNKVSAGYWAGRALAVGFASTLIGNMIRQYLSGDERWQREYDEYTYAEIADLMGRGSGLGIVVDGIMGNWTNGARRKGTSLLAPVPAQMIEFGDIMFKTAERGYSGAEWGNFVYQNTPIVKHPAIRAAEVYLFQEGIKDAMIDIFDF